jgi:catechol 2,3-dioxygenase-like lactoylglutathione lyase family enzyme
MDELPTIPQADSSLPGSMELGAFSMSLNVADLQKSKAFYEALGFVETGGDPEGHGYLMMKNGETTLGLFQGVIPANTLTFNPGLTNRMERIEEFLDVRAIEQRLAEAGIELASGVADDAGDSGPAHVMVFDPAGTAILIDQVF